MRSPARGGTGEAEGERVMERRTFLALARPAASEPFSCISCEGLLKSTLIAS